MATLTKEQILGKKHEPKPFNSPFWGGDITFRPAASGDKIDARCKASVLADLLGDKDRSLEHIEAATFLICVEEPKLSPLEMTTLMKQPGAAAEIAAVCEAILKRQTPDPTK